MSKYSGHIFPLLFIILAGYLQSCQSDARNSTRIPPVVKKSHAQWQKDALLSLTELIARGIDTDVNYFKRARIYFEREQYKEALEDINESITEQDNVSDYFLLRGKVNRELGNIDNALEDAQRAEALQQSSPELYVLLADVLQAKGNFKDAVNYLNQALTMAPYDASAYYVKGMLQARQGDSLASLSSFRYAMNVNPKLLRAYEQSIIITRKLKDLDQALEINKTAISRFPNVATLFFERGEIFYALAKPDTALINYQKALLLNPKYEDALMRVGSVGIQQKEYYRAIRALKQLLKTKPKSKEINNMLGYAYEKTGDYTSAVDYYSTALVLSPGDQSARNGLYRIKRDENENLYNSYDPDVSASSRYRTLDTSRVKINVIRPRGTTNIRVDSSRKAKIQ
jgi:tetratricopeptide (TPR) repeat protein